MEAESQEIGFPSVRASRKARHAIPKTARGHDYRKLANHLEKWRKAGWTVHSKVRRLPLPRIHFSTAGGCHRLRTHGPHSTRGNELQDGTLVETFEESVSPDGRVLKVKYFNISPPDYKSPKRTLVYDRY